MKNDEKASISLKRIIAISLIFLFLTSIAVVAGNVKLNSVKIILSSGYEMNVLSSKTKISEILDENHIIILEDEKTICSLTHNSLTSKTPNGQGAHGGVTPEEILVPVIIVSNQKNASNISAKILENDISATSPFVNYIIKGISSIDVPTVVYNDVTYSLHCTKGDVFESERLNLVATASKIVLVIGDYKQTDSLNINIGVQEDDLFNF